MSSTLQDCKQESRLQSCKADVENVYNFQREALLAKLNDARNQRHLSEDAWKRVHHHVRMELNVLENSVRPVLNRIDTLIYVESLLNQGSILANDVMSGIDAYETARGSTTTKNELLILQLLRDCSITRETPGYTEWKAHVGRLQASEGESVIVYLGPAIAKESNGVHTEDDCYREISSHDMV